MDSMRVKTLLLAGCVSLTAVGTAVAGGLERGGYNIDLLFDPAGFVGDMSLTYVAPQRELDDVTDINPQDGNFNSMPSDGIGDSETYVVPRIGFKAAFGEHVDCMVDYSQPWGAHTNPGLDWAGANSNIETRIDSDGFGATCSYKASLGRGQARLIGGVFYQKLDGFKDRLVLPPIPMLSLTGVGHLELAAEGVGWRLGAAYEIPDIALRVSIVYNSEVSLDRVSGVLDLTETPITLPPPLNALGQTIPVFGSAAMPQSVELKVQSGIAPGWLAFGSLKWVDWSVLQSIGFCPTATEGIVPCVTGGPTQATSLDLLYQDGWTVMGGIGHSFSPYWSGALSISWDRGTSTTVGTQSDTWTLVAGVSYTPSPDFELRLGGAAGILTSGSSVDNRVSYTYGNDFVGALSAAARFRF